MLEELERRKQEQLEEAQRREVRNLQTLVRKHQNTSNRRNRPTHSNK